MGLLLSVLCCCGTCVKGGCGCCFSAGKATAAGSRQASKATYVVLLLLSGLIAWILQRYGADLDGSFAQLDFECDGSDGNAVCSTNGVVYRISFVNVLFMTLMLLLTTPVPTCLGERRWAPIAGDGFHLGWWSVKLVLYFAFMCMVPFLPSSMFDSDDNAYAWVARVTSGLFLVLQVLLLIDFAYQLNEDWLARAYDGDEEQKGWLYGLIFISLLLMAGGAAGSAIMFTQYGGCEKMVIFNVINLVALAVYVLLSVFREKLTDQPGSMVPVSIVFFYTTYLVWSAIESIPDDIECRPLDDGSDLVVFVGTLIAMLSLSWLAYTASKRTGSLIAGSDESAAVSAGTGGASGMGGIYAVGSENGRDVLARDTVDREDPEESGNPNDQLDDRPYVFYLVLILASFYMAMILTNWGVNDASSSNASIGNVSAWVKITSSWLTVVVYIWTLLAPRILSGREFDY